MNSFRTEIVGGRSDVPMQLKSTILTQGSCFSDAIGRRLRADKMNALANPFGVIYNPHSIHNILLRGVFNEPPPDHTFLQNQGLYLNYEVHSQFSSPRKETLSASLTNAIGSAHYFLKDCDWLILTYGTAFVYQRQDTGEIVANCHKVPAAAFSRTLQSVEDVLRSFDNLYTHLIRFNPGIRIILTVSPVRHIKDTLALNSVSKSVLRLACHEISGKFDAVEYFPAYELMLDDLRDYRFYKSDMLHPSDDAEEYIWSKFQERYFSDELRDFVRRWRTVRSALAHRPFHPQSPAHQQFLRETLTKLEQFADIIDVESEMNDLKQQLQRS